MSVRRALGRWRTILAQVLLLPLLLTACAALGAGGGSDKGAGSDPIYTIQYLLVVNDSSLSASADSSEPQWEQIAAALGASEPGADGDVDGVMYALANGAEPDPAHEGGGVAGARAGLVTSQAAVVSGAQALAPEGSQVAQVREVARLHRFPAGGQAANASTYSRTLHLLRVRLMWQETIVLAAETVTAVGATAAAFAGGALLALLPESLGDSSLCPGVPPDEPCPVQWAIEDLPDPIRQAGDSGPQEEWAFYESSLPPPPFDSRLQDILPALADALPFDIAMGVGPEGVRWSKVAQDFNRAAHANHRIERYVQLEDGRVVALFVDEHGTQFLVDNQEILEAAGLLPHVGRGPGRGAIPPKAGKDHPVHHQLVRILREGRVVDGGPYDTEVDHGHALYWVKLEDPVTGLFVEAFFKPRFWGDGDGHNVTPFEETFYELNLAVDMDYVPPAAHRNNVDIGEEHFDEGVMLYKIRNASELTDMDRDDWPFEAELFESDTRILDTMMQNADRHGLNVLWGEHWVDGVESPGLIDHGASGKPGNEVSLEHDWLFPGLPVFNPRPIRVVRRRTFDAMQRLSDEGLRQQISHPQGHDRIPEILRHRDIMVRFFQQLADERGADNVIIDNDQ